jgi:type II restriction/modification system DNA methylase subunit YeeA
VLDPACGSGHILVTAFEVLYEIYKTAGYMNEEIPELILRNNLYGLDICDRASQLAQLAVIMKAREYDKNIFSKVKELNITSIQESNWIDSRVKECLMNGVENKLLATSQIEILIDTFKDAKEYGSILEVKDFDFEFWEERLNAIQSLNMGLLYIDVVGALQEKLPQLIKQAKIMQQKYECVIANPPYMGGKGMSQTLSDYVKRKYPLSKGDMFAVFKEVILNHTKIDFYSSTVNQHSWMFLSSYEQLREHLLNNAIIDTMVHLGTRAFEELAGEVVQTTTYITRKTRLATYIGKFVKLTDYPNAKLKEEKYLEFNSNDIYTCKQNGFHSIPGSPIAYWASDKVREIFATEKSLNIISDVKQGMSTADNNQFLRFWNEVDINKIGFNFNSKEKAKNSKLKWFPYNKGGEFRKWYGNNEYIVNWENDGFEIKNYSGSVIRNPEFFFLPGVEWSTISSGDASFRLMPNGFILGGGSSSIFGNNLEYIIGIVNSVVISKMLSFMSPTLNFSNGVIALLPIIDCKNTNTEQIIKNLIKENIEISKDDWDSFETSWDFKIHPLLRFKENGKIQDSFSKWKEYKQEQFNKLKANEEELNRLFIEIYGLQDEITPDVADKDITVSLADELREVKSLLSYAVGCMLGRYSLDEEGLAFAGGEFDLSRYETFPADEDAVIPVLAEHLFADDITSRFKEFLKVAFGTKYFDENLEYVANVLGKKNTETADDTIRNYFLKDFYNDHLKTYQKRPIYWLFSTSKGSFNALVYMHRYNKDTASVILNSYLRNFRDEKLKAKIEHCKQIEASASTSQSDKIKAQKDREVMEKIVKEVTDYEHDILYPLAIERKEIDLDDGVKVNYLKFGKALKDIGLKAK